MDNIKRNGGAQQIGMTGTDFKTHVFKSQN